VEKALKHVYHVSASKTKGKELELLLAILPDNNGSLYGKPCEWIIPLRLLYGINHRVLLAWLSWHNTEDVPSYNAEYSFKCFLFSGDLKRICETDLGLISQCCLTKHVFKITKQYLANVSLKINVKVCMLLIQKPTYSW